MGAGMLLGMVSCGLSPVRESPKAKPVMYEWADDGGPGELAVTLDLSRQIATYERGGRPIGWSYICTGKPGHATPEGRYTVTEMMDLKFSSHFGWVEDALGNVTNGDATPATRVPPGEKYVPAPMPHWMRLTATGIGMHGGIIPQPGETASHGCVRLPMDFAPLLYEVVRTGTPVKVVSEAATDPRSRVAEMRKDSSAVWTRRDPSGPSPSRPGIF